ncbi:hypothetical protein [Pseudomonas sp. MWU12-2345]|uniref:hypothetical protein n=1 Tax=Pseudomonas sp. MWU12-2345 TaxID=2928689 RepID=UPI0020105A33
MSALNRFHETANDALVAISQSLPAGAKICLAIYTPNNPELDIVLKDQGLDLNEVVSTLRRRGLSIDGGNAYKRDLCDSIIGSLAFGKQNVNPPPPGHWGQHFWDIGRSEGAQKEELAHALALVSRCLTGPLTGRHVSADEFHAAMLKADEVLAKHIS